ncbi:MAG: hypothetical protein N2738_08975 [Thermodesulfovibrionales bacterium]|nr:hypothetical protein [Thermodesulfovibrionales bacterium]
MCVRCKKIVDIHSNFELSINPDETEGFEIIGSHVEFYGLCPKCKET